MRQVVGLHRVEVGGGGGDKPPPAVSQRLGQHLPLDPTAVSTSHQRPPEPPSRTAVDPEKHILFAREVGEEDVALVDLAMPSMDILCSGQPATFLPL